MLDDQVMSRLADQSPDAIIFAGPDGNIAYWNAAAVQVFGHTAEAAMGQYLDIIIPEQYRVAHWLGFNKAIETGITKLSGQALATRAVHANGETIYVEMSFGIIKDDAGTSLGAIACARDITERFARDRDMRRELRALKEAADKH
ncbi:MAG: PAS domain-containing protein [Tepidiformaceae bacterium]